MTLFSVVVITHNRRPELLRTLARLRGLPEAPPVIVVDNASRDGTADAVAAAFPQTTLLRSPSNLGAVGRNLGVDHAGTPFVAFCDDDTWWAPGALPRAAELLDRTPDLAVVAGRVVVEPDGREDPIVAELRGSPLPRPAGLPGPAIGSFQAMAAMVRVIAFRQAGGFSRRLWLGGEEELLGTDLMTLGWQLCFAEDVVVHHAPSHSRDPHRRRRHGIRNTLWYTWLRRPPLSALRRTAWLAGIVPRDRISAGAFAEAVAGLPWVLRERRPVPDHVEARLRLLDESQRDSRARRYVS